ncbi:hypothetical protein KM043_007109 [Ampulex compressa]|nr:hypothetical protein KM043_007109 [Ampulex compressa]
MSGRDSPRNARFKQRSWTVFVGDFVILKNFLAEKEKSFWIILQLFDALLRGFGQVVFANNPISGLLIAVALAAAAPGTLILGAATAFLGLLLSVLMRDSRENIENGLTAFNPLLVGAVSFALVPKTYGTFDAFSLLLILLGTIFSVYLTRSLGSDNSPCTTWPFNLAEFAMLFVLFTQDNAVDKTSATRLITAVANSTVNNATSDATDVLGFIVENATAVYIDWGMIFQGVVMSASQVYAVENVIVGSVIYLAILIYSPISAGFAFVGALVGSLAGLEFGASYEEVYSGVWGFNSLLTAVALGGNLFVLNGQTAGATLVAIAYTSIVQYAVQFLFRKLQLPILTVPFILVTTLFVKLRNSPENVVFPRPISASFPEKQRHEYFATQQTLRLHIDDSDEEATEAQDEKKQTTSFVA